MTDLEILIQSLITRIAVLESEVARLSLFNTLSQETKRLKLDVSKFPVDSKKF
jgi:hypothetical protein